MAIAFTPNTGAAYNPAADDRPIQFAHPDLGIDMTRATDENPSGHRYTVCPRCSAGRTGTNQAKKCLRLTVATGHYRCYHGDCGFHGLARVNPDGTINTPSRNAGTGAAAPAGRPQARAQAAPVADPLIPLAEVAPRVYALPKCDPDGPASLTEEAWAWLTDRGLSAAAVEAFGVGFTTCPGHDKRWHPAVTIPYRRGGQVVNVKTRFIDRKDHRMVAGGEVILLNRDALRDAQTIVFVEGEFDALAVHMALADCPEQFPGWVVTSVPNGSPNSQAGASAHLAYLSEAAADLDHGQRIILAGDGDEAGRWLMDAIGERLGVTRALRVTWPGGCKDGGEALLVGGVEALRDALLAAHGLPIQGIVELWDIKDEMIALYENGPDRGLATGIGGRFDELYRPVPGTLTTMTGPPGCGKSAFLDYLVTSAARLHGWHTSWCSPEKQPLASHFGTLCTIFVGLPYAPDPEDADQYRYRQTREQAAAARSWVGQHNTMVLARKDEGGMADIPYLLEKMRLCVLRHGSKIIVLDPWNRFARDRPGHVTETEYTTQILDALSQFAKECQVCVILIAHPTKDGMRRVADGTYGVATADQIAGSAGFSAVSDFVISVWRDDRSDEQLREAEVYPAERRPSQVHVQKCRNDWQGRLGRVEVERDPYSRRFREIGRHAGRYAVPVAPAPAPDDDLGF